MDLMPKVTSLCAASASQISLLRGVGCSSQPSMCDAQPLAPSSTHHAAQGRHRHSLLATFLCIEPLPLGLIVAVTVTNAFSRGSYYAGPEAMGANCQGEREAEAAR
jgi:hypothetical protein